MCDNTLDVLRMSAALALIGWVPFVAFAVWLAPGSDLLLDELPSHVRWLVATPLLFLGENRVDHYTQLTMRYLRESGLIPGECVAALNERETRVRALSDSWLLEAVLLVIALAASVKDFDTRGSLPSIWVGLVGLPLFRFLLLRWLVRWLLWTFLLAHVSRIGLRLLGTHPDRAGGLSVVAHPSRAFAPVIIALGSLFAADIALQMMAGAEFERYTRSIAVYVVLSIVLSILPLFAFSPPLARAKREALYAFGVFGARYAMAFEDRWLRRSGHTALLGNTDVQALNDVAGSYTVIKEMRLVPFSMRFLVEMVAFTLIPIAPLYLASVSINTVISRVIDAVF